MMCDIYVEGEGRSDWWAWLSGGDWEEVPFHGPQLHPHDCC